MRRIFRTFAVLALLGVLATSAYAFTAANTVDPSNAGDGSAGITGYTVTGIEYNLAANPENIDSVEFDLTPNSATTVKARIGTGAWATCAPGGVEWTCDFVPDEDTGDAGTLQVVAAE